MTAQPLPDLRRLLLSLVGARPDLAALARANEADWQAMGRMIAQHRLAPLLHAQLRAGILGDRLVPPAVAHDWAHLHRHAAFEALAWRAQLRGLVALLARRDIACVALKGAFLAPHAAPDAAQRPLRDLDLLLSPDRILEARDLLLAEGYRERIDAQTVTREMVDRAKHLPGLLPPEGLEVELHMRAWDNAEATARAMPPPRDARILARARRVDGDPVAYPSPLDMLMHVTVHATYGGRLNPGPLALADCDWLLAREAYDWPAVWKQAGEEGWDRGLALLLTLTDRWRRPGVLAESGCPPDVPADLLDSAPDLLLQDPDRRAPTMLLAVSLEQRGVGGKLSHFARRIARLAARPFRLAEKLAGSRTLREAGAIRETARDIARMGTWMAGD